MSTYDPNSVSSGYLGFLQSAEMISNLIFASVVAVAVLFAVFVLINGRAKLSEGFPGSWFSAGLWEMSSFIGALRFPASS